MGAHDLPRLALTVGDPAGIGPEICLRILAGDAWRGHARVVVVGPEALRPADVPLVEAAEVESGADDRPLAWVASAAPGSFAPGSFAMGRAQAACGRAAIEALRIGAELARSRAVDALVTAPVSKEALHLAGEPVEGQTQLLARWDGSEGRAQMLAVAERLRILLLTRHLPLREAIDRVRAETVVERLALLASELPLLGVEHPRLALAGLNPHAGEGGLCGTEERAVLEPAVERARAAGIDVTGPISPDVVFLRGARGEFDAVLALYHDQAFIPAKLLAPGRGLTVLLGLSYLRVSPAHGTAFDIAGKGRADPGNLELALLRAAEWSRARAAAPSAGPR